jgi:Protein of unknown function (DUF2490)
MRPETLIVLLFFTSLRGVGLSAQKSITRQNLYWTRYYNQLALGEKWTWHNEIDNRRFFRPNRQHHLIAHTRLHYHLSPNAEVGFGFTYSLQNPHDPHAGIDLAVPEKRGVQELDWNHSLSKRFSLQHRWRIDERFIHRNNGKELLEGYDVNVRFRYRLQVACAIRKANTQNATILKIADELMVNAGKTIVYNHFDQNRIYVALEQKFGRHLSAELGYLYWYQQRPAGNQFFERNIIRFTLYHKSKMLR